MKGVADLAGGMMNSCCPLMTDASITSSFLWPFSGPAPVHPHLFCTGKPRAGPALQLWSHQPWAEKDNLPLPAGNAFSNAAHGAVDFLCHKDTLLTHSQLGVYQDPQFFSATPTCWHGALCSDISPSLLFCNSLFLQGRQETCQEYC